MDRNTPLSIVKHPKVDSKPIAIKHLKRQLPSLELFDEQFFPVQNPTGDYDNTAFCITPNGDINILITGDGYLPNNPGYWGTLYLRGRLYGNQIIFLDQIAQPVRNASVVLGPSGWTNVRVSCYGNQFVLVSATDLSFNAFAITNGIITTPDSRVYTSPTQDEGGLDLKSAPGGNSYFTIQYNGNVYLFRAFNGVFNSTPETVQGATDIPAFDSASLLVDDTTGEYSVLFTDQSQASDRLLSQDYFANNTRKGPSRTVSSVDDYKAVIPAGVSGSPIPFLAPTSTSTNLRYLSLATNNKTIIARTPATFNAGANPRELFITSCGPTNPNWFPFVRTQTGNGGDIIFNIIDRYGNLLLPQDLVVNELTARNQGGAWVACKDGVILVSFQSAINPPGHIDAKFRVIDATRLLNLSTTFQQPPLAVITSFPTLAPNQSLVLSPSNVNLVGINGSLTINNLTGLQLTFFGTGQNVPLPYYTSNPQALLNGSLQITGLNSSAPQRVPIYGCNTERMCTYDSKNTTPAPGPGPRNSTLAGVFNLDPQNDNNMMIYIIAGCVTFGVISLAILAVFLICRSKCYTSDHNKHIEANNNQAQRTIDYADQHAKNAEQRNRMFQPREQQQYQHRPATSASGEIFDPTQGRVVRGVVCEPQNGQSVSAAARNFTV